MKPGSEAERVMRQGVHSRIQSLNWSAGHLAYEVEVICFAGTYAHNAS